MQTQHISTILVSLSDRDQELQKKIERAKANINTSGDPAFWREDLAYWQGRLAEIAEARQALFDAIHEKQLVENIWRTNLFCYNLTMENNMQFSEVAETMHAIAAEMDDFFGPDCEDWMQDGSTY